MLIGIWNLPFGLCIQSLLSRVCLLCLNFIGREWIFSKIGKKCRIQSPLYNPWYHPIILEKKATVIHRAHEFSSYAKTCILNFLHWKPFLNPLLISYLYRSSLGRRLRTRGMVEIGKGKNDLPPGVLLVKDACYNLLLSFLTRTHGFSSS